MLKVGDGSAIYILRNILENPDENDLIKFETVKSLILLGVWDENVCKFLVKHLRSNLFNVRHDILKAILNGKNAQYNNIVIFE